MPDRMIAPFWISRAREQAARLRRVNAVAGGGLVKEPVDDVDLVLQRLQRRSVLLSFMSAPSPPRPSDPR